MLSKSERGVMKAIYKECKEKPALITPIDLLKLSGIEGLTVKQLENIMSSLYKDGYFDLIYSDRHGEPVYCITLKERGKAFEREAQVFKRNILFRLCLSAVFALISFVIGLILKNIFQ